MEGSAITYPVPALQEVEITSAAETRPGLAKPMVSGGNGAEPTASDGSSGGGKFREEFCTWSKDDQVINLKYNWQFVLTCYELRDEFDDNYWSDPWFAKVVSRLRVDPCLDSYDELEIDRLLIGGLTSVFRMTSLEVAILMLDFNMVQWILGHHEDPKRAVSRFLHVRFPYGTGILCTPLHLAVLVGDKDTVHVLLERGANFNAKNWLGQTPFDLACKRRNFDILQEFLKEDTEQRDPLHVAVQYGNIDFVRDMPSRDVIPSDRKNRTALHYLATYLDYNPDDMKNIVKYLVEDKAFDIKALDDRGFSAFYVAILHCNTKLVLLLLESFRDQIRLNEVCNNGLGPPIQIACEGGDLFKDIQSALMDCDPVKSYMERLYRDRQVYVDAANAILVGAALIASITFASWLQPPLNYTSYFGEGYSSSSSFDLNYVDVEHNIALRVFWAFNAPSFYFAIASVVCGARSVLPRSRLFIKKIVEKLHINLLVTSVLLACSMLFVIIAFAIAGTIVLTPLLKYQWYMIVPTFVGGMVCLISLVFLVKSIRENSFNTCEYTNPLNTLKGGDYLVPKLMLQCPKLE